MNSNKYELRMHAEFNDHGDQFKSRGQMQREYSTAKYGYVYDDDGNRYMQFSKKGRWVYYGTSERIKCYHRLVDKIKDTDTRLAKSQKYRVEVWWKLDYVSWNKDEEEFKVVRTDATWRMRAYIMNATSEDRAGIDILEKNSWPNIGPNVKGRSQLYWQSRNVPAKIFHHRAYTLWERKQHDELNSKSN